jgi:hypothetical protein
MEGADQTDHHGHRLCGGHRSRRDHCRAGLLLGWLGLAIGALGTATVVVVYWLWMQRWQHRWGATDEEVHRAMPSDDLITNAASTPERSRSRPHPNRSGRGWCSSVRAGPAGTARLGLDRQRRPAQRRPHHRPPPRPEGGRPDPDASRDGTTGSGDPAQPLPGRQRQERSQLVPGAVSDARRLSAGEPVAGELAPDPGQRLLDPDQRPGPFIMERKMLKGIKARAERAVSSREDSTATRSPDRESRFDFIWSLPSNLHLPALHAAVAARHGGGLGGRRRPVRRPAQRVATGSYRRSCCAPDDISVGFGMALAIPTQSWSA